MVEAFARHDSRHKSSRSSSGRTRDGNSAQRPDRQTHRQGSIQEERANVDSNVTQSHRAIAGLSCTKMLSKCGVVCTANTGPSDCGSTICVRLQQECLSTGCWRGKLFSSCGLIKPWLDQFGRSAASSFAGALLNEPIGFLRALS